MAKLQFLTSIKFHTSKDERKHKYQHFWEFYSLFSVVEDRDATAKAVAYSTLNGQFIEKF